ncbi:MAG: SDR family NAD(P)-dependent oxidoreductase [Actinomycetota bacterium]|nr:SDR family NAD(P)-dependent oxidoreductase [Actinomycetota bacterium]
MKTFNKKDNQIKLIDTISLEGKKTIITGAASGIGRATSLRLAEAGSELWLVDKNEKALEETKKIIEALNIKIKTYIVDLSKKENIDDLWESFDSVKPDILINNSGIYPSKGFLEVDKNFYDEVLCVNLNSVFWMCQKFIKSRGNAGGIIVNTSSIEALVPVKEDMAHYSISKSGIYTLTRNLAHDFGKKGFRINGVVPGTIITPGINQLVKKSLLKFELSLLKTGFSFKSRLPMGRFGKPDEVAKVILFLCSDLASYVHGAMIPVDGGFLSS